MRSGPFVSFGMSRRLAVGLSAERESSLRTVMTWLEINPFIVDLEYCSSSRLGSRRLAVGSLLWNREAWVVIDPRLKVLGLRRGYDSLCAVTLPLFCFGIVLRDSGFAASQSVLLWNGESLTSGVPCNATLNEKLQLECQYYFAPLYEYKSARKFVVSLCRGSKLSGKIHQSSNEFWVASIT